MYPELFHIGNFVVFSYGFFIMLGVLMAFLFFYFKRKKINLSIDDISELFLWCFASVLVILSCFILYVNRLRKHKISY